jgi:hypothetical protein
MSETLFIAELVRRTGWGWQARAPADSTVRLLKQGRPDNDVGMACFIFDGREYLLVRKVFAHEGERMPPQR